MTRTRWILAAVASLFVIAVVVTVLAVPTDDPPERFVTADQSDEEAAVTVLLNVDSVDADRNLIRVRLRVIPGPEFPEEGVTLTTTADALPVVELGPGELPPETVVELGTVRGDVTDYPFDRYRADIQLAALRGTGDALQTSTDLLPVALVGFASAAGFSVEGRVPTLPTDAVAGGDADPDTEGLVAALELDVSRDQNVRVWALAMMAINWVLALAAVAVTTSVVLGDRGWESRHLAWLGSMLFALAAFRNTAPGNPIIGTFLDFYAFFPAEAIITLCLGALVTSYLLRPREELGL